MASRYRYKNRSMRKDEFQCVATYCSIIRTGNFKDLQVLFHSGKSFVELLMMEVESFRSWRRGVSGWGIIPVRATHLFLELTQWLESLSQVLPLAQQLVDLVIHNEIFELFNILIVFTLALIICHLALIARLVSLVRVVLFSLQLVPQVGEHLVEVVEVFVDLIAELREDDMRNKIEDVEEAAHTACASRKDSASLERSATIRLTLLALSPATPSN